MNFWLVSPSRPTGPRTWILSVLMPISAPRPYSKPSAKRVEAFTITELESTSRRKRRARVKYAVPMHEPRHARLSAHALDETLAAARHDHFDLFLHGDELAHRRAAARVSS